MPEEPSQESLRLVQAEQQLGVRFRSQELLYQALTHRSFLLELERDGRSANGRLSNERLEFLGDAVLSAIAAQYAYTMLPDSDEGELTEIRSALVRRSTLALLAEAVGLGTLLYTGRAEHQRAGKGHATVLAEAFEAIVAAVFLDQGFEAARKFLEQQFDDHFDTLLRGAATLNPKSRLQELLQAQIQELPQYSLISRTGPPHDSRFTVEVVAGSLRALGRGSSIRLAEQDAAGILLNQLQSSAVLPSIRSTDDRG